MAYNEGESTFSFIFFLEVTIQKTYEELLSEVHVLRREVVGLVRSEAVYQAKLIKKIQAILPGCFIMKNPPDETQGIPDLLILWGDRWAMLEVKVSAVATIQPNQAYYVDTFNDMSFAAFIYPENEEVVLSALQSAFGVDG